ncbi:hypothetical protein EDB83DRAFT_2315731 [Lactarius deliciosus]|nr:hypothetical protein EDB83DRAFT_2315731 [Lactarius deliciosus]
MAVAVIGVAVAGVIVAMICSSRVANEVSGSLCGRQRAVACYESVWRLEYVQGEGRQQCMATVVLHKFEKADRGKSFPIPPDSQPHKPHPENSNNDNPMPMMTTTRQLGKLQGNGDDKQYDRDHNCDGSYGDDNKNTTTVEMATATTTTKGPRARPWWQQQSDEGSCSCSNDDGNEDEDNNDNDSGT